jgi:5'-nucleotidase (lipoprotein e(P4) family)
MEASTLWVQNAAEYKALTLQAYNVATLQLKQSLKKSGAKNKAIILDLDETVLDNSPYQASGILEGRGYTESSWDEWVKLAKAQAVPGALDFLNYAHARGVEIFYITNRRSKHLDPTYQNLVELGIPVERENMMMRTTTSNKTQRRQFVLDKYQVLLYIGDVMADLGERFEDLSLNEMHVLTEGISQEFGKKYIILPNPMYGDWERAFYEDGNSSTAIKRARQRRNYLYPYE